MRTAFLFFAAAALVAAQDQNLSVWRIEVRGGPLAGVGGEFTAQLETAQHQNAATASMRSDNFFEFRNIVYGDYWLTISDAQGRILYRGMVSARSGGWQESIDLGPEKAKPLPGGPVSVGQLRRPPSRKAFGAFAAAQHLSENGQFQAAAQELEKAARLSPDWPDAHTNLAAQYIRLGRFEDAVREAGRAIELNKPNPVDLGNIAYAEAQLHRRDEAIDAARAGLRADANSAKLHYILGTLLAMDRRTLPEAVSHLELAAKTLDSARPNLEKARKAMGSAVPPSQTGFR